jgi:uncharacterized protein
MITNIFAVDIKNIFETYDLVESYVFKHKEVNILLDVNKSDFFEVDDLTYSLVRFKQEGKTIEHLMKSYSENQIRRGIEDLVSNEILVKAIPKYPQPSIPTSAEVRNMVLNISQDCNLRCKYCFASTGHYNGERGYMSEDVAKKALDWFVKASGESKDLNMHLFGGEPLMNLPLVKIIIDYVHELEERHNKKIYINICTNGTILNDELIELIKKNEIGMQISIDGPREIHDKYRPTPNGKSSYDIIVKNLRKLFEEIPSNQIIPRATIPHDLIRINDVVDHLFELGFKTAFFIPAMGCGNFVINEDDFDIVKEEYNKLIDKFISKCKRNEDYNIFPFITELDVIGKGIKRLYGCGAGIGFVSVDINGDVYPCMRFTNREEYKIGNVSDGFEKQKRDLFFKRTTTNRTNCKTCWARYFCGGACISIPTEIGEGLSGNAPAACEVAKHITKLAMYANAVLSKDNVKFDNNVKDFMRRRFQ